MRLCPTEMTLGRGTFSFATSKAMRCGGGGGLGVVMEWMTMQNGQEVPTFFYDLATERACEHKSNPQKHKHSYFTVLDYISTSHSFAFSE